MCTLFLVHSRKVRSFSLTFFQNKNIFNFKMILFTFTRNSYQRLSILTGIILVLITLYGFLIGDLDTFWSLHSFFLLLINNIAAQKSRHWGYNTLCLLMILLLAAYLISPCLFGDIGNFFSNAYCTNPEDGLSPKGLAEMNADWKAMSEADRIKIQKVAVAVPPAFIGAYPATNLSFAVVSAFVSGVSAFFSK